tara:strand:- start:110 stop:265 length:156 start_codon:yes stop_codon:yes gene_type:complete
MKKGDTINFKFAGGIETGEIIEVEKKGNKIISYTVSDEKYRYSVIPEKIVK